MSKLQVTASHIYYILVVASKDIQFFQYLYDCITDEIFNIGIATKESNLETQLYIVWDVLREYYKRHHTLPDNTVLKTELLARSNVANDLVADPEFIEDFLDQRENAQICHDAAYEYTRAWLNERKVLPKITREARDNILELDDILNRALRETQHYSSIAVPERTVFDILAETKNTKSILSTGIPFIDTLIDGGFGDEEVAVLLGATGAGKTTLAVQMLCSAARLAYRQNPNNVKKMVLFSYEDNELNLAERIICYSAQLPRHRWKQIRNLENIYNELSDAHHPQPYELTHFSGELESLIGERERLETARDWLDAAVRAVDFSGRGSAREAGCKGIPEIARYLKQLNTDIGLVIIDWAGMLVRRYLEYRNERNLDSARILRLQALCDDAYRLIASEFKCPVLIVHQLNGQANKASPTAELSHADAEGCKTFAVNAWHAFVMGPRDNRLNIVKFICTKTRSGRLREHRLLQLNEEFCRFEDVTHKYIIDRVTRKIISNDELRQTQRHRQEDDILGI
jgi:energy-coupling factor transporter ATP-binding protein EcfA2